MKENNNILQEVFNNSGEVQIDPQAEKIKAIKSKADHIRAKADLLKAKNQFTLAKITKSEIKDKLKSKKPEEIKVQTIKPVDQQPAPEVDMNSGDPLTTANEDILVNKDDLNSGDPLVSVNEVEGDEQPQPEEDQEQSPENDTNIAVAGSKPETKEEAEIARIQAHTREIQARTGEYNPPGGQQDMEGMDPNMDLNSDPNAQLDPMTGMPVQPQENDPMKGFGDTTDPAMANGMMGGMGGAMMGGIDPMTGMPTDQGPAKTLTALGRLYELKKIHYRLTTLDKILSRFADVNIEPLRKDVSELVDVFTLICNNLKSYKDSIDEIIVNYYIFIKAASKELEDYLVEKKLESEQLSE